jgi:GNAT superfamily N-acetyltransferase
MTVVIEASEDRLDEVGAMLGRAFLDDALLVYMLPDDAERARLAAAHFTPFVKAVHRVGTVYITPDVTAAACWCPPGTRDFPPDVVAATGLDRMGAVVGDEPWARISGVFEHLDARREALGVGPHWYLALIGVDPAHQGTGLGGAVIRQPFARADAAGEACYLETLEARNVPFYERHGFRVIEDGTEPVSGQRYWLMLREPYGRVD